MTLPGIPCSFLGIHQHWLGKNPHDASVKGFVGICQHNLRFSTWGVVCRFVNPFHNWFPSSPKSLYPTLTESSSTANHPKKQCFASNLCMVHVSLSYISESQFFLGRVWSNGCFTPPCLRLRVFQLFHTLHPQKFVTFRIGFFLLKRDKNMKIYCSGCVSTYTAYRFAIVYGNYQFTYHFCNKNTKIHPYVLLDDFNPVEKHCNCIYLGQCGTLPQVWGKNTPFFIFVCILYQKKTGILMWRGVNMQHPWGAKSATFWNMLVWRESIYSPLCICSNGNVESQSNIYIYICI